MTRGSWTLLGIMCLLLTGAVWASHRGIGVPQPVKQPVSIREGSARGPAGIAGQRRIRYFVGGGMHHGK